MRKDFKRLIAFIASIVIVFSSVLAYKAAAQEAPLSLGVAANYSVFLEGDFNVSAADCEGNLAVGGSAQTPGSYDVGKDASRLALVGGSYTGFLDVVNVMTPADAGVDIAATFANLRSVSSKLATYEANGEITTNPYNDEVYFKGDNETVNIFKLSASEWNSLVGSDGNICVVFQVPSSSTIIINITGSGLTALNVNCGCKWNSADVVNGSSNNAKIIWNIPDANSFGIGASMGCLLAPNSDITSAATYSGCHFEGQVIAKSFTGTTEFGCTTFTGALVPATTPTPVPTQTPTPTPTATPAPTATPTVAPTVAPTKAPT
ncbi:MAG: choice-of-anchor A family protein, partial [Saccharofermentans sp.]|nr:choice-of-anchor A family protein [Saccharofermentans sp.]